MIYITKKISQGLAIACLLLNILLLPGLGSLIAGKIGQGIAQIILCVLGGILFSTIIFSLIGIPMIIAGWIWALISGIQIIQEAK